MSIPFLGSSHFYRWHWPRKSGIYRSIYTSYWNTWIFCATSRNSSYYTCVTKYSPSISILSDSQYSVHVTKHIETATIKDTILSTLYTLFTNLQQVTRHRQFPFYIPHIRAHTNLPGPLTERNARADVLLFRAFTEAPTFHDLTHCNSKCLKTEFHITWAQAKQIVRTCPTCQMVVITTSPTETGRT